MKRIFAIVCVLMVLLLGHGIRDYMAFCAHPTQQEGTEWKTEDGTAWFTIPKDLSIDIDDDDVYYECTFVCNDEHHSVLLWMVPHLWGTVDMYSAEGVIIAEAHVDRCQEHLFSFTINTVYDENCDYLKSGDYFEFTKITPTS